MLLWILIVIGVITLDQVSKLLVLATLKGEGSLVIINKVLRFTYVENRGAAFGMLDDKRWVFLLMVYVFSPFVLLRNHSPHAASLPRQMEVGYGRCFLA